MADLKHLVILSGMSGAGKATCAKALEDMGFFVVDNLPPQLLADLVDIAKESQTPKKLAVIIDIREREFLDIFPQIWHKISHKKIEKKLIFLDASNNKLIERFKETKRDHPLSDSIDIVCALETEREILRPIRLLSDIIIDTDKLNSHELKKNIKNIILKTKENPVALNIISFGYKNGLPLELDLCFDVRFIKNPYYDPELKSLTGLDGRVSDYVLSKPKVNLYINKITNIIAFTYSLIQKEGRSSFYIAIGCTGGKHRSVAIAEAIKRRLQAIFPEVKSFHRDMGKN